MPDSPPIRVIIVDDHNMVRRGLVVLLDDFEDLDVIAEAADGEFAVNLCQRECPDVVLMDMMMPRMNGIEAISRILEICPETKLIALTSFSDEEHVQKALEAGATSYIIKDISGCQLVDAIRRAHTGESTLSPAAAQTLIKFSTRPPAPGHDLTEREREVLALMITGLNNREISESLVISSSTVKNHVSRILQKLNTTSRTQAVALAVKHKILEE